jgi:hypothetical protein
MLFPARSADRYLAPVTTCSSGWPSVAAPTVRMIRIDVCDRSDSSDREQLRSRGRQAIAA